MEILTAKQIKELDAFTIANEKITSTQLMHRAASKCFDWIKENIKDTEGYIIVCGPGNNGGDGLVLAQLLTESNCEVECVLLDFTEQFTHDYLHYLKALKKTSCTIHTVQNTKELKSIHFGSKIVVDAVFGIGLSRPAEGIAANVIDEINSSHTQKVLAIDLPSGLYCEKINTLQDSIIQADVTLTFHVPKLSFFFPEGGNYPGEIVVLDIGLNLDFGAGLESENYFITQQNVAAYLQKRLTFTHKGSYGHAHIIAGSRGKMGAAVLATKAASCSGVGLITASIPSVGLNVLQTQVPVAMCEDIYGVNQLTGKLKLHKNHTYGIGPGIGTSQETMTFVKHFLKLTNQPLVIDADALNCIANDKELLKFIPENSILTPHIKEFERLVGKSTNSLERLEQLLEFCKSNQVVVVLKDARTIIGTPTGQSYMSLNGTPGMATGGSGDVLTGILTGLLAQGYTPEKTTQLGVILHGVAGELAAKKHSQQAMTAETIIEELGKAFKQFPIR